MSNSLRPPGLQVPLSSTISWSLLKFMSIESVMLLNHLILCFPLLLLPSMFPSIRVFPSELALRIKWPNQSELQLQYQSPFNEYSALISFRIHWFDLLAIQGTRKSLLQHDSSIAPILWSSAFFYCPALTSVYDYWEKYRFDCMNLGWQSNVSAF